MDCSYTGNEIFFFKNCSLLQRLLTLAGQLVIMKHLLIIAAFFSALLLTGCGKAPISEEDQILGTWVKVGSDGTGPAGTLQFTLKNGKHVLQFNCSGSPGPSWPSTAETEYKFQNGKLTFINYADPSLGFYSAESFNWTSEGQEFEVKLYQLLHYMSADYTVKYRKVN